MNTRLVVFDIAGTTVKDDNVVAKAFMNAFLKNGFKVSLADTYPYMGVKKIVAVEEMLVKLKASYDLQTVEKIHEDFTELMLDFYTYHGDVKALPGVTEVFSALQQRSIAVALNTGFPKKIADAIVDRMQWMDDGLIDDYIASDEVNEGRPSPLMIKKLMRNLDIEDPAQVVKVGDTEVDVLEGRNSHCGLVISVTTGSCTKKQLQKLNPDHILDNIKELLPLI